MNSVACQHSSNFSLRQSKTAALLIQLRSAHDQLAAEIENLDRITHGRESDPQEFTSGRWRISQASLKRRGIACRIFDFLAGRLGGADLATLKAARVADQDMMRRSASHVGTWSMKAICSDWPGYCTASRQIRMHMSRHIQFERDALYPLLERLADQDI